MSDPSRSTTPLTATAMRAWREAEFDAYLDAMQRAAREES
jgi:hypothetical protein